VFSKSVRVGGDKMDEAIAQYIKRKYNLLVGERTAELIKITIALGLPQHRRSRRWRSRAADLVAGVPKTVEISDEEIRDLAPGADQPDRRGGPHSRSSATPPELASDIRRQGDRALRGAGRCSATSMCSCGGNRAPHYVGRLILSRRW